MDQLQSHLNSLRRKSALSRFFIPQSSFSRAMTQDAIFMALAKAPLYYQEEMTQRIYQQGKKVFGVLVLINCPLLISNLIEADQLDDAKLPFKVETLTHECHFLDVEARQFEEKQWELLAPTFYRGTLNRRLGNSVVLPFAQEEYIGKGGFGQVYKTVIESEHQELGNNFPEKFARKELLVEENHRQELENLAILNHLKHPNIVELLSSYTHNGKHSLLFPLADSGNLTELLNTERDDTRFTSNETIVIALAALSSALEHVHDFLERRIGLELKGCHHDLRPRNVLVSGNTFILADFGLSTFKPTSQNSATPFRYGNSDDYLAPECEDWSNAFQPGTRYRSSDVWSLGCIIAELATYMAHGCTGVREFRQARCIKIRSFVLYQFHCGALQRSEAVECWLAGLEKPKVAETIIFLVRVARKILILEPNERPKAREVTGWLRLVSLYEVSSAIDKLFRQLRCAENSDILIEHSRFDSWRYAMGILTDLEKFDLRLQSRYDTLSQFHTILECLNRLREELQLRLARVPNTPLSDLSSVWKLNDELECFLGHNLKQMCREYFIVAVMKAEHYVPEQLDAGDTSGTLSREIRLRMNIKYMNSLLSNDDTTEFPTLLVESREVELKNEFGDYQLGQRIIGETARPLLLEWRRYGQRDTDKEALQKMYRRVAIVARTLSQEKPDTFRTLQCSGFFHEPARAAFGLIFDIPCSAETEHRPTLINLAQTIEQTMSSKELWPDLDDRFKLASTLALSLLELHAVGLLHKNITTSNIIFFREPGARSRSLLEKPFLIGFDYSRPNDRFEFTSGVPNKANWQYQHPMYLTGKMRYRPEFDYYSIGIILLEIGNWAPYTALTKNWKGTYEERRQQLVQHIILRLRRLMGREYAEAALYCLECGSRSLEGVSPDDLLLEFEENVIVRLRKHFS